MIHAHTLPALLNHGYGIEQVKQWRTEQEKAASLHHSMTSFSLTNSVLIAVLQENSYQAFIGRIPAVLSTPWNSLHREFPRPSHLSTRGN
jgi:seryl-tRNA synthetase